MNDSKPVCPPVIEGTVAPGFERVREVFARNFTRDEPYRDVGAAVCAYHQGRCVVDLWAGHADRARTRPWQADTLVNLYSATKGVVGIAAALLASDDQLDYVAPVTRYWPEFGAAGKGGITVEDLLAHRARLYGFDETTTVTDLYDWHKCCSALARQKPAWSIWDSDMDVHYHAVTWGYLVGEVMRRAGAARDEDRETVGQYVQRRLAGPLAADFFIGLPEAQESRVAEILRPTDKPFHLWSWAEPLAAAAWSPYKALYNPSIDHEIANQRAWRKAEIPAANGHASARGLARIYGALTSGRIYDGAAGHPAHELPLAEPARKVLWTDYRMYKDRFSGERGTRTIGASVIARNQAGDPGTIGHIGWGGCLGCADSDTQLGFGYVTNQMGKDLDKDRRGLDLLKEVRAVPGVAFTPA